MLDFNAFIFICVAAAFSVVGGIVWVADAGLSDKQKSLFTYLVICLTVCLVGLFFMIEDDSEFQYSGAQKVKRNGGGSQRESMAEGGGGGGGEQKQQQSSGGGGGDSASDAPGGEEGSDGADDSEEEVAEETQPASDCDVCPEMVEIAPGLALVGSTHLIASGGIKSGPAAQQAFHKPFHIGKYEVTVEQFQAFVQEMNYQPAQRCARLAGSRKNASYNAPGFTQSPKNPVVCISWEDAKRYTMWLTAKTGKTYRLPTEIEWEFAARAGTTQTYMTGEDISTRVANFRPRRGRWLQKTMPVGSYRSNNNGMYDVHGNAWEMVSDCWSKTYQIAAAPGGPTPPAIDCSRRIVKGGSWASPAKQTGFPMRGGISETTAVNGLGFRVLRE